jgi:hypothetical protein
LGAVARPDIEELGARGPVVGGKACAVPQPVGRAGGGKTKKVGSKRMRRRRRQSRPPGKM